jgi:hypothetical protein
MRGEPVRKRKKLPPGAPKKAPPKGPTPRKALERILPAERLIIADIQDAMDAIWKAKKR